MLLLIKNSILKIIIIPKKIKLKRKKIKLNKKKWERQQV